MPDLTFRHFQRVNAKRCPEGFDHELHDWSPLEWAGAMCGEAGEVANVCKKMKRKTEGIGGAWADRDPAIDVLREQLAREIGDTVAYLSLLASAAGLDLQTCVARKFDEISDKVKWNGPRLDA